MYDITNRRSFDDVQDWMDNMTTVGWYGRVGVWLSPPSWRGGGGGVGPSFLVGGVGASLLAS